MSSHLAASTGPAGASGAPAAHKIGLIPCIAFAVGSMIGGGVFAMSGVVVNLAGAGAILAYILAGLVVGCSALCFAVVASRATPGDSGYTPVASELGPLWRFITMWAFYIMSITGMAFVMLSFGNYLQYFLKGQNALLMSVIAAGLLILLNLGSANLVGRAETAMIVFKVIVLIILICFGIAHFSPSYLNPIMPDGVGSVFTATALLFSAYLGFSVVTNMAAAVNNPQRTVPAAILLAVVIVAIIYVGIAYTLVMTGERELGAAVLAQAADKLVGPWGGAILAIAACVSTLSGSNALLLGLSELMIRMAALGDIPSSLGRMSRGGHAYTSVIISGGVATILMLSGDIPTIISYCSVAGIIALSIKDLTALRIALKGWGPSGIRLPLGPVIPVLAILFALAQLFSLGWGNVAIGTALVGTGFIFHFLRERSHPSHIQEINDHLARLETPLLRTVRASAPPPASVAPQHAPPSSS